MKTRKAKLGVDGFSVILCGARWVFWRLALVLVTGSSLCASQLDAFRSCNASPSRLLQQSLSFWPTALLAVFPRSGFYPSEASFKAHPKPRVILAPPARSPANSFTLSPSRLPFCSSVLNLPSQRQIHLPNPPPTIKMKFFLALAAAAIAVANAADCDITKLSPLLTDVNVKQCSKDTGFSPPIPPTAAMMPKVCASTACQAALTTLKGLGLGDCVILGTKLETDLINPIAKACAVPVPAPAPAPATPTTDTPTPGTTPAPTTKKPVC